MPSATAAFAVLARAWFVSLHRHFSLTWGPSTSDTRSKEKGKANAAELAREKDKCERLGGRGRKERARRRERELETFSVSNPDPAKSHFLQPSVYFPHSLGVFFHWFVCQTNIGIPLSLDFQFQFSPDGIGFGERFRIEFRWKGSMSPDIFLSEASLRI